MLQINDFELQFSEFNFFLLVLSTTMIAGAGYIINDYFDTKIDRRNDPSNVIVGKTIKRRVAMIAHIVISAAAIVIGFFIAWRIGFIELGYINVICTGMLWYYSTTYKHRLLIGNVLIAVLAGLVPLIVALYEIPLLNKQYNEILITLDMNFNHIFTWIAGFSFFAFLVTLIREIIKDMEDIDGDWTYGSKTLPITLGTKNTKVVLGVLILITIFLLSYIQLTKLPDMKTFVYFLIAIQLPFVLLIYKIVTARDRKSYHFASSITKFIMLTGILYTVLVNYIVMHDL